MKLVLLLLLTQCLFLSACTPKSVEIEKIQGRTMGTGYSVLWPETENVTSTLVQVKTEKLLILINDQMSTYQADSELSLFNSATPPHTQSISGPFAQVIDLSLSLNHLTKGYFDISVGPLVNLWGFGPDMKSLKVPSAKQIEKARSEIGLESIKLEGLQLSKQQQRYLDLSAIAKGFAVDQVAELLETLNITSYLVEIGGEIRVKGQKPGNKAWKVAVEAPDIHERRVQKVLSLKDVAMATSGDYRNYFEDNGQRYSHSINPFTAKPMRHTLASVTVIDESCARADALATAMLVMGDEKAVAFAKQENIRGYFIVRTENGFIEHLTPAFERWVNL
jgi:thiamine biosynthesis lipoprotein